MMADYCVLCNSGRKIVIMGLSFSAASFGVLMFVT